MPRPRQIPGRQAGRGQIRAINRRIGTQGNGGARCLQSGGGLAQVAQADAKPELSVSHDGGGRGQSDGLEINLDCLGMALKRSQIMTDIG